MTHFTIYIYLHVDYDSMIVVDDAAPFENKILSIYIFSFLE